MRLRSVCFLVQRDRLGEQEQGIVPVDVNDLDAQSVGGKGEEMYTPIHLFYMRLLDDGDGEQQRKRGGLGVRKGVSVSREWDSGFSVSGLVQRKTSRVSIRTRQSTAVGRRP